MYKLQTLQFFMRDLCLNDNWFNMIYELLTLSNTFCNPSIPMVRVRGGMATPSSRERAAAGGPAGRVPGPIFKTM